MEQLIKKSASQCGLVAIKISPSPERRPGKGLEINNTLQVMKTKQIKPLIETLEDFLDRKGGERLLQQSLDAGSRDRFRSQLANLFMNSNEFISWLSHVIEDPDSEVLSHLFSQLIKQHILSYLKFPVIEGKIEDMKLDWVDIQEERKDPYGYRGLSKRNVMGV